MYPSLLLQPSQDPTPSESAYRSAGLVTTKGTIYLLPPPLYILRDSYASPPRPQTRMSSGAVALCKHFERGGASSEPGGKPHPFWKLPVGSNQNKTMIAEGILEQMLGDAVWRNVMLLHAGVAVYEVRNSRGYGMRWTLDVEEVKENRDDDAEKEWKIQKTTFRGFLEPIEGLDHELYR